MQAHVGPRQDEEQSHEIGRNLRGQAQAATNIGEVALHAADLDSPHGNYGAHSWCLCWF